MKTKLKKILDPIAVEAANNMLGNIEDMVANYDNGLNFKSQRQIEAAVRYVYNQARKRVLSS